MSHSILESTEALKAEVNKFVKAPELYYVDEPFLNEAIKNGEPNQVNKSRVAPVLNTKLIHIGATNNVTKTAFLLTFLSARK